MAKKELGEKDKGRGEMTVREAGLKVRELVEAGKEREREDKAKSKK